MQIVISESAASRRASIAELVVETYTYVFFNGSLRIVVHINAHRAARAIPVCSIANIYIPLARIYTAAVIVLN